MPESKSFTDKWASLRKEFEDFRYRDLIKVYGFFNVDDGEEEPCFYKWRIYGLLESDEPNLYAAATLFSTLVERAALLLSESDFLHGYAKDEPPYREWLDGVTLWFDRVGGRPDINSGLWIPERVGEGREAFTRYTKTLSSPVEKSLIECSHEEEYAAHREVYQRYYASEVGEENRNFPKRAEWLKTRLSRLTASGFANRHGHLSAKTIKKILRGKPVTESTLEKLAEALGCDPSKIPME